jgi:hypothetical protein
MIDDMCLKCSVRYWNPGDGDKPAGWDRKDIDVKPFIKTNTDDEYNKLLKELNIPA